MKSGISSVTTMIASNKKLDSYLLPGYPGGMQRTAVNGDIEAVLFLVK